MYGLECGLGSAHKYKLGVRAGSVSGQKGNRPLSISRNVRVGVRKGVSAGGVRPNKWTNKYNIMYG